MSSQLISIKPDPQVTGLIFYGFPLHSPAKPGIDRAEHLKAIKVPMLFLQGNRDALARLDLLEPLLEQLPMASLKVFEGANHSFKFLKKSGVDDIQALALLATASREFVDRLI